MHNINSYLNWVLQFYPIYMDSLFEICLDYHAKNKSFDEILHAFSQAIHSKIKLPKESPRPLETHTASSYKSIHRSDTTRNNYSSITDGPFNHLVE